VLVFVLPPSAEVLAERLRARDTETPADRRIRLGRAADELLAVGEYDYVVINEDLGNAVSAVGAILEAEARRVSRQQNLAGFVESIRRGVAAAARADAE